MGTRGSFPRDKVAGTFYSLQLVLRLRICVSVCLHGAMHRDNFNFNLIHIFITHFLRIFVLQNWTWKFSFWHILQLLIAAFCSTFCVCVCVSIYSEQTLCETTPLLLTDDLPNTIIVNVCHIFWCGGSTLFSTVTIFEYLQDSVFYDFLAAEH